MELIDLIIEAGAEWHDDAEYAAQDSDRYLAFYRLKPWCEENAAAWSSDDSYIGGSVKKLDSLCHNWNQTIVTREQYEQYIERRPDAPQYCESVMRQMPGVTIEQRIASLRALDKQVEETRVELTRDLEALGLTWMVRDEPEQPTITDWRDLRVGDVIWWEGDVTNNEGEYTVKSLESKDYTGEHTIYLSCNEWVDVQSEKWRFIRRP